ncbi:MAG: UMP kinase [Thermoplasmata archaeon]|nr:MAG: UMP kinase [Thermoplasmata archaeon]
MKRVVIDLGGSLIASPQPNAEYLRNLTKIILELSERYHLIIVAGGGEIARKYIKVAQKFGASEKTCDELGILATKLNAKLLIACLGDKVYPEIPDRVSQVCLSQKIFILGGTTPGQTTDAVAAKIAEECKAQLLVVATNVDGIYEEDPKKNPKAKKFERLSFDELLTLVQSYEHHPGFSGIIDKKAAETIARAKIKTIVIDGRDVNNIKRAIEHQAGGTIIWR